MHRVRAAKLLLLTVVSACGTAAGPQPIRSASRDVPPTAALTTGAEAAAPSDRTLWTLIQRFAADPGTGELAASDALAIHYGETESRRPLASLAGTLDWIGDHVVYAGDQPPSDDDNTSVCRCNLAALRCEIWQPGGRTVFTFKWLDNPRRLRIQTYESEDP